jgi:hypothetical protein
MHDTDLRLACSTTADCQSKRIRSLPEIENAGRSAISDVPQASSPHLM